MKGKKSHSEVKVKDGGVAHGGKMHGGHPHHGKRDHHVVEHTRARGGALPIPESGGHPEKLKDKPAQSARKRGGKVHGKHPGARLDKRARGGRMTPGAPYSGADAPNLSYAKGDLKPGSQGEGKDKT